VEIGSRVWAVRVARKDTIPTKLSGVVDPRDVITLAKYEIEVFIIVSLVSG